MITGHHAAIDPAALGPGLDMLVHNEMADQPSETIESFEAARPELDEVVSCRRTSTRGIPDDHARGRTDPS